MRQGDLKLAWPGAEDDPLERLPSARATPLQQHVPVLVGGRRDHAREEAPVPACERDARVNPDPDRRGLLAERARLVRGLDRGGDTGFPAAAAARSEQTIRRVRLL